MISSVTNPGIKQFRKLMASARLRRQEACFPVEGPRMFFEVPRDRMIRAYVTETFADKYADKLEGLPVELVSDQVMKSISDTRTPQGVVCLVRRRDAVLSELVKGGDSPCFFLLENLRDPGNLGTIIRTGEAAGVTGIIVSRGTVDPYNPKVIRSTMGAVFRVPILESDDLTEVCSGLQAAGVSVYAAALSGDLVYAADFRKGCAFLIGNEGAGLSGEILAAADRRVRIPMQGKVESLNAAAAAAVLMYEMRRQREYS